MRRGVRLVLAAAIAASCSGSNGGGGSVPEGDWGGENLALHVHAAGAEVFLDCAHGAITVPLRLDSDGSYSLPGYFVADVGPTQDPELRRPATYFGSGDDSRITLSFVLLDGGGGNGPFTATLGGTAQLQQCR